MAITPRDGLLVIDVQNDFCSGGALAVPDGESIVPVVNALMERCATVVLTQDWHPAGHSSFASSHPGAAPFSAIEMPYGAQMLWPDHCVQGSHGAAFHPDLLTTPAQAIIRKGMNPALDSYSAFYENDRSTPTGLTGYLTARGITRVLGCGLATDYCVFYSLMDARAAGFEAVLVADACRGLSPEGIAEAVDALRAAGVAICDAADL